MMTFENAAGWWKVKMKQVMATLIKMTNESQMMFVKGWAENIPLLIKNNPWFVSVKTNMESPNLTITAEQTHLCVFTFPAPKPVLAPSFHDKSSVFYFEKEKKEIPTQDLLPIYIYIYIQLMTVLILIVLSSLWGWPTRGDVSETGPPVTSDQPVHAASTSVDGMQ